ncbi:uncharacterized protein LOC127874096 [Dreissena polymorpha]|uniref:B box-type domain-containing protein n=1 Tax=Dreissena polymorpha TaxID=45954 RepID=A0A9D4KZC4_DREPO|nr:uncharacterized protein LOC127874096 [Dreissena polymorpha]KAH3848948.1 hypothetical protein DPMN_091333 [Dreissena polymorpha]
MASNLESSINRGSDLFFDFACFPCQENDRNTEADVYCEECSKLYCNKCVEHHNLLYKKHAILSKKNISRWPRITVDEQEQCQEHKKEKLTIFCEDHSQLICHVCHVHNHLKCSHVVLIADKVKDLLQKGDFKQLSENVDTQHRQLVQIKDDFDENMKSLEKSYKKILNEIDALRKKINDSLDQLERNTKQALDTLLATMRTSIQTDIENCTRSIENITCLKEDWCGRKDTSEALSFIKYRKCHDQSLKTEAVLKAMTTKNKMTLSFNPDKTIQHTLSTLSWLGQILSKVKQLQTAEITTQKTVTRQEMSKACNTVSSLQIQPNDVNQPSVMCDPKQVITVKSSKKYYVKMKNDSCVCCISGICETAAGELIITDLMHNKVKLLDQTYKVVDHYDLPSQPIAMRSIDSSLVAITGYFSSAVHFIRVTNGQLIKDRILELKHHCMGIAHHQGNLYITDGKALYHYTVDGRLVSKMYKGASGGQTVTSCGVSPDGARIYVANEASKQLVTLSGDGLVIRTLTDPALDWGGGNSGIHVTDSGQVLVCGGESNIIIQVDNVGRQRLTEVVTKKDGVFYPISVYYSKHRGSLIVGMMGSSDIIVFEAQ